MKLCLRILFIPYIFFELEDSITANKHMLFRKIGVRILTFCLILLSHSNELLSETVQFIGDKQQSTTTGYSLLKWEFPASHEQIKVSFILQQSLDPSFTQVKTLYEGPDYASFVSGLSNGEYYYRVGTKSKNSPVPQWSEPLSLEVAHHSKQLAMSLFVIGIIIFLSTAGVIVVGNLKYNK